MTGFRALTVLLVLAAVAAAACAKPAATPTVATGNAFINVTADPYYKSEMKSNASRLLVEFGVAGTPALANVMLETDQPPTFGEKGFGVPKQKDIIAPDPARGSYTTGSGSGGALKVEEPRKVTYRSENEVVTNFASLYIYLESQKPLKVLRAEFNGQTFELADGKLLPRQ